MHTPLDSAWLWTLTAFTLHNAEETWSIANGWSTRHAPELAWTVDYWPQFGLLAALVVLLVAGIASALRARPAASRRVLVVFLWLMLMNVVWHVGVSVHTASIAPGAITAVLVLLPLHAILVWRLSSRGSAAIAQHRSPDAGEEQP